MKIYIDEKYRPIFKGIKQKFNLKDSEKAIAEKSINDMCGDFTMFESINEFDIKELKLK